MGKGKRKQPQQWRNDGTKALDAWLLEREAWIKKSCEKKRGISAERGALFINEKTCETLTLEGLKLIIRRVAKRAGVGNCTLHTFRRGRAAYLIRSGVQVYHVQAWLGHSSLATTERYLRNVLDEEKMAQGIPADL